MVSRREAARILRTYPAVLSRYEFAGLLPVFGTVRPEIYADRFLVLRAARRAGLTLRRIRLGFSVEV